MRLMCLDFEFHALNSTVEHDENTTFEDPSTDGGSNRLASLHMLGLPKCKKLKVKLNSCCFFSHPVAHGTLGLMSLLDISKS